MLFVRDPEGTLVSMRDVGAAVTDPKKERFYIFDGLGSVIATTDEAGDVVRRYDYEPYGKEIGNAADIASDPNPWRYASGYYDKDTGWVKFGTRYYMPDVARWTQKDPVFGSPSDPMSLNAYLYVGDNPSNLTDSTGRLLIGPVAVAIIAAVVGGGVGYASHELGAGPTQSAFSAGCAGFVTAAAVAGTPLSGGAVALGCAGTGGVIAFWAEVQQDDDFPTIAFGGGA